MKTVIHIISVGLVTIVLAYMSKAGRCGWSEGEVVQIL